MKPSIVATLICLCCHTAASLACETTPAAANMPSTMPAALSANISSPPAMRLVATAAASVDAAPVVRRTAAHAHTDGVPSAYTQAVARPMPVAAPSPAGQPAPAPEGRGDRSETMLAVALALMAGIALRRWGSARP